MTLVWKSQSAHPLFSRHSYTNGINVDCTQQDELNKENSQHSTSNNCKINVQNQHEVKYASRKSSNKVHPLSKAQFSVNEIEKSALERMDLTDHIDDEGYFIKEKDIEDIAVEKQVTDNLTNSKNNSALECNDNNSLVDSDSNVENTAPKLIATNSTNSFTSVKNHSDNSTNNRIISSNNSSSSICTLVDIADLRGSVQLFNSTGEIVCTLKQELKSKKWFVRFANHHHHHQPEHSDNLCCTNSPPSPHSVEETGEIVEFLTTTAHFDRQLYGIKKSKIKVYLNETISFVVKRRIGLRDRAKKRTKTKIYFPREDLHVKVVCEWKKGQIFQFQFFVLNNENIDKDHPLTKNVSFSNISNIISNNEVAHYSNSNNGNNNNVHCSNCSPVNNNLNNTHSSNNNNNSNSNSNHNGNNINGHFFDYNDENKNTMNMEVSDKIKKGKAKYILAASLNSNSNRIFDPSSAMTMWVAEDQEDRRKEWILCLLFFYKAFSKPSADFLGLNSFNQMIS